MKPIHVFRIRMVHVIPQRGSWFIGRNFANLE